jgi:TM2 domain-containing membrane protein YozV
MSPRFRPTFTLDLSEPCAVITRRLRSGLGGGQLVVKWARLPGGRTEQAEDGTFVLIAPPAARQRLFSPWLQLSIRPSGGGTELFGRFSPRPDVWTAFAMSYLLLACVTFFAAVFGVSQLLVKQPAWGLWTAAATGATLGILWLCSVIGQRLAAGQMGEIREAVERAAGGLPHPPEFFADCAASARQ